VLETPRLTLRGHRASDLEDSFAMWSNPEVTRHITGKPSTREEVWARILRYIGHWAVTGYGLWHIRERASDRFVGEAGLAQFKRDMDIAFDVPETGWIFTPWSHGRGYATEAMQAILTWATPSHPRTICMISPSNAPSLRVAAKLGYREIGPSSHHGADVIVFERGGTP
jgi:RimJ/RimL family protein N-acetyltransferase